MKFIWLNDHKSPSTDKNSTNMNLRILTVTFFVGLAYSRLLEPPEKLKVTVFYESHCQCSTALIKKNIYPVYKSLKDFISIEFVPFGNTKRYFENGEWYFQCKKDYLGLACRANKIHACAVSGNNTQDDIMEFVNCILDGQYTEEQLIYCSNFSGMNITAIEECVADKTSTRLLGVLGNLTASYQLHHIPAVIYENYYNQTIDEHARRNFLRSTCSMLSSEYPPICGFLDTNDL